MPSEPHQDLFESTKMTFGEHLEELRIALFKAILALVVGFSLGLLLAPWVVRRVQDPMVEALRGFYHEKSVAMLLENINERKERGDPLPENLLKIADLDARSAELAAQDFLANRQMLPEESYLDLSMLIAELKRVFPKQFADIELGELAAEKQMIRADRWVPYDNDYRTKLKSLNAQEPFMVYVKGALVAGAVIASPFIFYFIWNFVASGLYPHEKRYVHVFMPFSLGLFLAGAALAFFVVFRYVLVFLFSFNSWLGIDPDPRISEYLSFVLLMPLGFGVSFQLPLVMLFLERIGVFTVQAYIDKWRVAILVVAVVSMLLTPADPGSMILMAVPLTVLYFGGIGLCHYMPRPTKPFVDVPV